MEHVFLNFSDSIRDSGSQDSKTSKSGSWICCRSVKANAIQINSWYVQQTLNSKIISVNAKTPPVRLALCRLLDSPVRESPPRAGWCSFLCARAPFAGQVICPRGMMAAAFLRRVRDSVAGVLVNFLPELSIIKRIAALSLAFRPRRLSDRSLARLACRTPSAGRT